MDSLLRPLLDAPPLVVYLVCGLLITAETALLPGIVLPTLLLMGFLAERGTLHLGLALAVAVVAAVLGDQLAYLEGRWWGPRLARRVGQDRWNRAESAIARWGVPAVIAGRCVLGLRTLMPRVAGSAAMPYRRFAVGSVCAALLWASAELLAGHLTAVLV